MVYTYVMSTGVYLYNIFLIFALKEDVASLFARGLSFYNAKNYADAVAIWTRAASRGHVRAQHGLGKCCEKGWGLPQDYGQAVSWYRRAADQGHAAAQNNLGLCYKKGWGSS
ncbi:sel1 repeat family protein [archaeon]|nr:MAG: sel1 repeat family protein [archaeon]